MKTSFPKLKVANVLTTAILASLIAPLAANATVVEFDTSEGKIKVNLYDETTPTTVENFLNYLNSGSYDNTIIHRSIDNFIIQGGGYYFEDSFPLKAKDRDAAVRNEPIWSNITGTIAMAKISGNVNSATNQWFFNMADNSANLDVQNGGFTAFGQVIEGLDVLTAIAQIPKCPYSTSITDLPMPRDEGLNCTDLTEPSTANFVTINSVTIFDAAVDSASNLTLTKNELLDSDNDGEVNTVDNDDDGDGVLDVDDLYPFDANESADTDGDGSPDNTDKFPNDATETTDFDEDGTGDNADLDDDNDGVNDVDDAFPFDASETSDRDGDGVGDNVDEFPDNGEEWRDLDKDGYGDNIADACPLDKNEYIDSDGDGYCDGRDVFPDDINEYLDTDLDGIGDNADDDDDNDGVKDKDDYYPTNPDRYKDPYQYGNDSGGSLSWFVLLSLGLLRLFKRNKV